MAAGLGLLFLLNLYGRQQSGIPRQGGAGVSPTERTSPFGIGPTPRQPSQPRLSFNFSPSQLPPGQPGGNEFLRSGPSSLIKSCTRPNRVPCSLPSNDRGECLRRGCCWNPSHPIRCARAIYFDPPADALALAILLHERIVGGVQAPEGEWPWTVLIYFEQLGIPAGQICGGTLVSDRWIVTAAHCIETNNPALYAVALGINNLISFTGNEVFRLVQTILIHPQFDLVTFDYDVALLELNMPVNFTRYVRPLCVVPFNTLSDENSSPFAGAVCTTVGWGNITSPLGPLSTTLQQLDVTIDPNIICQIETLPNSAAFGFRPVTQDSNLEPKFCASGGDRNIQDSCVGDSGGPLFCLHTDGRFYLHGITSYGTVPCAIGLPGIYTKVGFPGINSFITSNVFT